MSVSKGRKGKKGRPSKYTAELGDRICELLAEGKTLLQVCKPEEMPSERAVRMWALKPDHPFSSKYVRAREVGYYKMADEIVEISDDASHDYVTRYRENGESYQAVDHDHISRSRLRVDSRKWLLSKALPKVFGDKVALTDPDGGAARMVMHVVTGVPRGSGDAPSP